MCVSGQGGTIFDEQFEGAAFGTDGSVVMSGYTYGSWSATTEGDDDDMDFVAMSMDANRNIMWTYQVGAKHDRFYADLCPLVSPLLLREILPMPLTSRSTNWNAPAPMVANASCVERNSLPTHDSGRHCVRRRLQ